MSTEENKGIARRFFAEQDRLGGGPADALCAPDYKFTLASNPPMDLAGHKQLAGMFYAAFPDLNQTIEDQVAEGDKVVCRMVVRGTHHGTLMGIAPTGKSVTLSGMAIMRISDNKVAELREEFDQLGMLQQLGAIPAPGQAGP